MGLLSEFRTFYGGRRLACIKSMCHLETVMVAQDHEMSVERTASYFNWPDWKVQAGLNYYAAYPEEIDPVIKSNRSMTYDKLKRLLPDLGLYEGLENGVDRQAGAVMLSYLLDENMSPEIAVQVSLKRPSLPILSLYHWRDGSFAKANSLVLQAADRDGLTLVT